MADIILEAISKSYGSIPIINNFSLTIKENSFTTLVGPSGCGKTTLLRMIAGLEKIDAGNLTIDGKCVNNFAPKDREIAMVFQSYALYPHMTVFDNMAFGLKLEKKSKFEVEARVREAARILQLDEYLERKPKQLSGGQRQRVAIGRAITRKPKVFLFDEPLSNLDASLRVQMRLELAKLHQNIDATMIYVTHDQTEAMTLSDEIVVMDKGNLSQKGKPIDLYKEPKNLFVASFIGSPKINTSPAIVKTQENGRTELEIENLGTSICLDGIGTKIPVGSSLMFGIRPEDLTICNEEVADIKSEILVIEKLGSNTFIYLNNSGETFAVETGSDTDLRVGSSIFLKCDKRKIHLFDITTNNIIK